MSEDEIKTCSDKVQELLRWIDENPEAHAEEFENKKKELEGLFNPIASKAYQQ